MVYIIHNNQGRPLAFGKKTIFAATKRKRPRKWKSASGVLRFLWSVGVWCEQTTIATPPAFEGSRVIDPKTRQWRGLYQFIADHRSVVEMQIKYRKEYSCRKWKDYAKESSNEVVCEDRDGQRLRVGSRGEAVGQSRDDAKERNARCRTWRSPEL